MVSELSFGVLRNGTLIQDGTYHRLSGVEWYHRLLINLIWKLNFVAHCIINIEIYLNHLDRVFVEHLQTSIQHEHSKNTYS